MSIFSPLCDDIVDFGNHNSNARKNSTYNPSGKVVKITPHHMAMVCDAVRCAQAHYSGNNASATYYIGNDGKICGGVSEDRRPWTSSSRDNDFLAITIEVSNSATGEPWPVSDKAFNSLVRLCVDICKRNGISKLNYTGDANGNLTRHNMFAKTACPGQYLQGKFPELAEMVNAQLSPHPQPTPQPQTDERKIWDYLLAKIGNEYGVAGMMGNLYGESHLLPNNLQDSFNKRLGMTDDEYCAAVDNGTYSKDQFVHDGAGIGLAQWTFWQRKENLYNSKGGRSIADLDMQLDFLWWELSTGYKTTLAALKTATSVYNASTAVLTQFEKPANQSEAVRLQRAKYGQGYYDKYATGGGGDVPQCPYIVRITATVLNVRSGPGTQYPIVRTVTKGEAFTIVEQSDNWGKLKSGVGWICLDYTEPIKR